MAIQRARTNTLSNFAFLNGASNLLSLFCSLRLYHSLGIKSAVAVRDSKGEKLQNFPELSSTCVRSREQARKGKNIITFTRLNVYPLNETRVHFRALKKKIIFGAIGVSVVQTNFLIDYFLRPGVSPSPQDV